MKNWLQLAVPVGTLCSTAAMAAPATTVTTLRCENVDRPMGVEKTKPLLSWNVNSTERGWKQGTYRILVASDPKILSQNKGDLWDSGQVKSSQTSQIAYAGKPLVSRTQCFWKVRTWNTKGVGSGFSAPSKWEMGLLSKSDWHGKWIGYDAPIPELENDDTPTLSGANWVWFPEGNPLTNAPEETRYFRRSVSLPADRRIKSAKLRVAADNSAVIFINGKEVGNAHDSWKSVDVFDVASQLTAGENVIAISVENEGTAAGLAAELVVQYQDGAPLSLLTDARWKSAQQPGTGWQAKSYDDSTWQAAREVAKVGGGPWGAVAKINNVTAPPAPYLRRTFNVGSKLKRATAYIVGLGYHELSINGKKVGDHFLDPGWTRYDRRSLYVVHDVTSMLTSGQNAVGVILGTGHYDDHVLSVWDFENATWRTPPKMLLEMRLDYEDGRSQTITSDSDWKASTGPITFDSISTGEHYDARLELKDWDKPSYQATGWKSVEVVEPVKGILAAQIAPPVRVTQSIKPVKITQPQPGVWLFDLGQNIAGVPQLKVQGPAGTTVKMRCGELLHKDGSLDATNIDNFVKRRVASQEFQNDHYTLKGTGTEVWNPRFTYHGFQYIEVKGFPGTPTLDSLRGLVMHSDFKSTGSFNSSNPILNKTQQNSRWSYIGNFHAIPTDCPHREKNGWTGDAHLAAELGLYNYDGAANYEKWLDDIADEQHPDGSYEGIIPTSGWGGNIGPSWDSAYPLIVWYLYEYKGDVSVVQKHYPHLKRYLDYLTTRSKDGVVSYGLGDWLPAKTQTNADITSTGYYYVDAMLISKAAKLLGNTADEKKYADLAASIRVAFNKKFYNEQTGIYGNGSITSLSCAIYQGLVEPQNKAKVLDNLVAEIKKQNYNMDVGILGAKYVLNTLVENDRADVAYQMLQKRTFPSYGYWVDQNATTLWEEWNGNQSHLHVMFGDVSAWFFKYLAGIKPAAPGFKEITIKPYVLGDLTFANGTYDSAQGRIVSDWKLTNGALQFNVTIPANTTATVY
ncbi:hypothetical protein EON80_06755, partial [bacterium]